MAAGENSRCTAENSRCRDGACTAHAIQPDLLCFNQPQVLFVHTGGLLGMYDKAPQLQPLVAAQGRAHRLVVD